MNLLAGHLCELGHRRVAYAVIDLRRRNLLREALIELGAKPADVQPMQLQWREGATMAGRLLAQAVLEQKKRASAVFTFSDDAAAGLIGYALEHGVDLPRELSVAGYDDGDVARAVWPSLTTIRQPLDEMARTAVALLMEPASDGKVRNINLPVELIVRRSTAAVNG